LGVRSVPPPGTQVTIYVVKYLFTVGIYSRTGIISTGRKMVEVIDKGEHRSWHNYYHGNEWFLTMAEAVAHAKVMVAKKRKTIATQLAKLDELERTLTTGVPA
jgi:hypothetical protein